jgi:hypothetical protein
MSDILLGHPLLAAAPLDAHWDDPARIPLAALPCLHGVDLASRTPFLGGP